MIDEEGIPDGLVLFVFLEPPKAKGGFFDGDILAYGHHLGNVEETAGLAELLGGGCAVLNGGKMLLAFQPIIDQALKRWIAK